MKEAFNRANSKSTSAMLSSVSGHGQHPQAFSRHPSNFVFLYVE